MRNANIREVTGSTLKSWYEELKATEDGGGCFSICFASDDKWNWVVCMGWLETGPERIPQPDGTFKDVEGDDGWRIAAKVGRQTLNNIVQCDYDIDFEMPCHDDDGEVDDTERVFDGKPETMKEWNRIASWLRKDARRMKEYAEGDWHMYK